MRTSHDRQAGITGLGPSSYGIHARMFAFIAAAWVSLAGCTGGMAGSRETLIHRVQVSQWRSDFHQSRTIESNSLRLLVDAQGQAWPSGLTLNARAQRSTVDDQILYRGVHIRYDILHDGRDLESAYAYRDRLRDELQATCQKASMVIDSETLTLPIDHISAHIHTDKARMPVLATDTTPDLIARVVEENSPDQVVVSVRFSIHLQQAAIERLAGATEVRYKLCGFEESASDKELNGLKTVFEWALM